MEEKKNIDIFEGLDLSNIDPLMKDRVNKLSDLMYTLISKRIESNISQRDLAKLSNIKQPMIARIEKMTTIPRLDTFVALILALGLDIQIVDNKDRGNIDVQVKGEMYYNNIDVK